MERKYVLNYFFIDFFLYKLIGPNENLHQVIDPVSWHWKKIKCAALSLLLWFQG